MYPLVRGTRYSHSNYTVGLWSTRVQVYQHLHERPATTISLLWSKEKAVEAGDALASYADRPLFHELSNTYFGIGLRDTILTNALIFECLVPPSVGRSVLSMENYQVFRLDSTPSLPYNHRVWSYSHKYGIWCCQHGLVSHSYLEWYRIMPLRLLSDLCRDWSGSLRLTKRV